MTQDLELEAFYDAIAPHYDGDYAGLLGGADIAFYTALAQDSGGPVLETGCGTGRVLLPVARSGVTVHGMDASAAMLERLRAKLDIEPADVRGRVTTTLGDIRSTELGARFALVFAAGNVLHSFLDRADQRAWFRNVRRHLAPRGSFCFDVFQPDYRRLLSSEWIEDANYPDPATGGRTRRFTRCLHELEWQRFRVEMRWVKENAAGEIESEKSASVMQRWFTRGELENLLDLEGFHIADYWGSFAREPFGKGSPCQIIRAV